MRIKLIFLSFAMLFFNEYPIAEASVSVCYARTEKLDCIQTSARLEVDTIKNTFVLEEQIERINCWSPEMPTNQIGKIVVVQGYPGRPGYQFIAANKRIIGSVSPDQWTATYTGVIDGFYFSRCSIH